MGKFKAGDKVTIELDEKNVIWLNKDQSAVFYRKDIIAHVPALKPESEVEKFNAGDKVTIEIDEAVAAAFNSGVGGILYQRDIIEHIPAPEPESAVANFLKAVVAAEPSFNKMADLYLALADAIKADLRKELSR